MIKWHEVTPFSRLVALFLLTAVIPALFFYIGMAYQDATVAQQSIRSYDFPLLEHYPENALPAAAAAADPVEPDVASSSAGYTVETL